MRIGRVGALAQQFIMLRTFFTDLLASYQA
ncbi:hypothetical protein SAMN05216215_100335 [Saccharopolyspora shandongensis]|uniref:Uncharacterized protein n=1 Tax=Saccharopolyspora shandongensis TaxID=418495 RepID=A0A1H2TAA7_9PSEU|nr:hypothetical protein SAMN05216215_100335 [Saccharopolyspora shandongensis]